MSWDLYLVPSEHGDDAGEWLESIAEAASDSDAARRHGEAIRDLRPELVLHGPFADGSWQLLPANDASPLAINLDGRSATIKVAFWDLGGETTNVGQLVADVARALEREAGFVAFDPQEDRVVPADEVWHLFERWHPHGVATAQRLRAELESRPLHRRLLDRLRRRF